MTQRRVIPYDAHIPPDLWVKHPRADLRQHLIEAVLAIAQLRGAISLDVQEALSQRWSRPAQSSSIRNILSDLPCYDLAHRTVQPIVGRQTITLFRLTERGKTLARSLGVEPIENGWDTLVRTHQGEKQVKHAALLLYTDRLARERGWQTVLTPQVKGVGFHPDLWIDAGSWSMYVEVESRWRTEGKQWDKWHAAQRGQGFAAIIARTEAVRDKLIHSCRASSVSGIAADLETLRLREGGWWQKAWISAYGSADTFEYLQSLIK
jgi:hypothetical protein